MALAVTYQHLYAHAALRRPCCACLAGVDGGEAGWRALIDAGANDFGGISPVTKDYVNPEKPWPHLHSLAAATAAAGKALVPRYRLEPHQISHLAHVALLHMKGLTGECTSCHASLGWMEFLCQVSCDYDGIVTSRPMCRLTVYPEVVKAADRWLDSSAGRSSPFAATLRLADGSGYARASPWSPGMASSEDSSAASESAKPPQEHLVLESGMSRKENRAAPEQHAHSSSSAPATGVRSQRLDRLPLTCAVCGSACSSGCTVAQALLCPGGWRM